ncbi:dynactin subunit 4-like [Mizuhopecten yessoensis]|uniref:dynactin subunit 4-like n=1 Tax=Mizuhopecten yessoensis TaxID=6573 RepID=UPI000B458E7F|nr:dynactin subunit 4-like [Mizuhopecten yessoensis]
MATFQALNVNLVKYVCSCGKNHPVCRLYLCRHCLKLRCGDCVLHEVDTPYCPNCLEHMPSTEAKLKKNRCSNCFDCPSCGHTMTTRATSQVVTNPDDPSKTTSKKVYYLACGFCRWTTRDVSITDKPQASGCWEALENPDSKRIFSLLETYQQLAQREKTEKERKKYVRRRSYLNYAASMDKYGLTSVAAKKKASVGSSMSTLKENEEAVIKTFSPSEAVVDFDPLTDDFFTKPVLLDKIASIGQRLASPEFQPEEAESLHPRHKHLLIRRSLRCKECEHNLSKPEFNPVSIKFKIQLIALLHVPEIRMFSPTELKHKKECKIVLSVCNPAGYNTTVSLLPVKEQDDYSNSKVELPKQEVTISSRDDAAIYDDGSQGQEVFKDDPSIVKFRRDNKIGLIIKVTPGILEGDIKVSFWLKHDYRNTAIALPSEGQDPQTLWLQHRVLLNIGPLRDAKG